MNLKLFRYNSTDGWQPELRSDMDGVQTLVLVFGAENLVNKTSIFDQINQTYQHSIIMGCSTSGEIFDDEVFDDTISMAVLQFDSTQLEYTSQSVNDAEESFSVGQSLAEKVIKPNLKGILVLSDGLCVNGSELTKGLSSVLPPSVVVTGGLAGDAGRFESTWTLVNGRPQSGHVCVVGYYGDHIDIQHGSRGGWGTFGPKREITRSKGNVLFELDGQPALQLYKKYLGERAEELPSSALLFPLALQANDDHSKLTVRTILAVSEEDQSLTFAGDIPQGEEAQLMRANFDDLIDGAGDAAALLTFDDHYDGDMLNIAISCVGRRLVLGERAEDETEATLDALPKGAQQIGFYSYGEISPHNKGEPCSLHNQTMTLTTLSELK